MFELKCDWKESMGLVIERRSSKTPGYDVKLKRRKAIYNCVIRKKKGRDRR